VWEVRNIFLFGKTTKQFGHARGISHPTHKPTPPPPPKSEAYFFPLGATGTGIPEDSNTSL